MAGAVTRNKVIRYWLDSGANIHSCREGKVTLKELDLTEQEWLDLSDPERDDIMRGIAFECADWGYRLED